MNELAEVALAFPSVVFTVPLFVVLSYWLFVAFGVVHIDLLGGGDAAAGLLDGDVGHGAVGHGDVGHGDGHGHDGHGHDGAHQGSEGILQQLRLRSVPLTVVVSLVVAFSWLASVVASPLAASVASGVALTLAHGIVLLLAPVFALVVTAFVVRPMGKLFVPIVAKGRRDFVGKVCVVRTATVDATFGEATLEDGGAGLVFRVRTDDAEPALRRGDQALIVSWDEERDAFVVAPMRDMVSGAGSFERPS